MVNQACWYHGKVYVMFHGHSMMLFGPPDHSTRSCARQVDSGLLVTSSMEVQRPLSSIWSRICVAFSVGFKGIHHYSTYPLFPGHIFSNGGFWKSLRPLAVLVFGGGEPLWESSDKPLVDLLGASGPNFDLATVVLLLGKMDSTGKCQKRGPKEILLT